MDGFAEHIAHVDMDAFFVEVERLRRPELRGRAVLVGGSGPRGVVASASYEARSRGARSAMPVPTALRRCPHAVLVPPDHVEYRRVSRLVFEVLESVTPMVEALSVDEAFLDVGGLRLHHHAASEVGELIRRRVREEVGIPASVGIATSKFLAKLASEDAKPDGLLVVESGAELDYLHAKPVRRLWGVGEATLARLDGLGITTIGELATVPAATLEGRLGPALGGHLLALAEGRDDRPVDSAPQAAKSISVEHTYDVDLTSPDAIDRQLVRHADSLATRLRAAGMAAHTVTLKVRDPEFRTITRSQTLSTPVDDGHRLQELARALYERAEVPSVRLLGLGGSGLVDGHAPRQLDSQGHRWDDIAEAVDEVRARFGPESVKPARLVDDKP